MQRTPVLISFLLIRLHPNIKIGFSEPRHRPQNLLPRSHQQTIAGRSPLCQFLRGGKFIPQNHSRCSPLQCHRKHQNHRNHGGHPGQRPYSPRPRALSFTGGPCRTRGSSASNRAARSRTSSSSAEHFAQLRRCSSRSFALAPVSAASRNGSFHFSHALFISSRPTKIFAPCATATAPSPLEFQVPRPRPRPPSLQPAKAAARCGISAASALFLSAAVPASPVAPRLLFRQPQPAFQ